MKLHAVTSEPATPVSTCTVTMARPAHDTLTRVLLALRRPEVTVTGVAFADDDRLGAATATITTTAPLSAAVGARLARLVGVLDVGVPDASADQVGAWTVEDWEVRQTPTLSEAVLRLRGPAGRHLVLAEGATPGDALRNARSKARDQVGQARTA
ncbi:MAG TPA: hypothetical protein VHE83_07750 [Mycobacteriales bacterium]|nr:hypothetical protein [Mycobacteriales bacterium]